MLRFRWKRLLENFWKMLIHCNSQSHFHFIDTKVVQIKMFDRFFLFFFIFHREFHYFSCIRLTCFLTASLYRLRIIHHLPYIWHRYIGNSAKHYESEKKAEKKKAKRFMNIFYKNFHKMGSPMSFCLYKKFVQNLAVLVYP